MTLSSMHHDTCVITSYFNPCNYANKYYNFRLFEDHLARQQAPLYVIELASTVEEFRLPKKEGVFRVFSSSALWHKERLLNLLLRRLPPRFKKVCWVDCDLIFDNDDWLTEASSALDEFQVIQLFDTAVRLPRGHVTDSGNGIKYRGFAATTQHDPTAARSGWFVHHGHTGFAWAGHLGWLKKYGLYDACMSGSGDHLMAHAFLGDIDCRCVNRIVGAATPYRAHFDRWAKSVTLALSGSLGYVGGTALHLWHGEFEDRRYPERDQDLIELGYDPLLDLGTSETGCLEWMTHNKQLQQWGVRYFRERREDPDSVTETSREAADRPEEYQLA